MFVTRSRSARFDPDQVVDPDRRGAVAWGQFNESFAGLQTLDWRRVNEGTRYRLPYRALRRLVAFVTQKRDAILDLERKARALARFPVPRDPDVVFFGAEAGWEALLVQALFGAKGRVVLIDSEEAAYRRFLEAPGETRIRAPRGFPEKELAIRRDRARIEYLRADLFDVQRPGEFDVGIDWGLVEHYEDARKLELMRAMQGFLRPGGLEITSVPRDRLAVRVFYYAFQDELNFGYRELLTMPEFRALLERGGYEVLDAVELPAHNVCAARPRRRG